MQHIFSLSPFISEPAAEYRSKRDFYLTSHQVIDYDRCPLLYKQKMAGLINEGYRDDYAIGSAAHCMILEGLDRFWAEYVVGGPINPTTERPYGADTKKFREWAKASGKAALSDDQYALVCQLYNAVKSQTLAAELLKDGIAEGVLRAEYCGLQCQARLDWFSPQWGIIDLKTCADISVFEHNCRDYGYIAQMAFYRAMYWLLTGERVPVYLVAVEKREPYRCGVWLIDAGALDGAQRYNEATLGELTVSRRDNVWPTGYEELRILAG